MRKSEFIHRAMIAVAAATAKEIYHRIALFDMKGAYPLMTLEDKDDGKSELRVDWAFQVESLVDRLVKVIETREDSYGVFDEEHGHG